MVLEQGMPSRRARPRNETWTSLAHVLGISKQELTAFRRGRAPVLPAEAVFRLCAFWEVGLAFQEPNSHVEVVICSPMRGAFADTVTDERSAIRLSMDFDESFKLSATPNVCAVLTRKPPSRSSFIGIRVERVTGE